MFFALSKIGFFLIQPSNIFLLVSISGLVLLRKERRRRLGWRLAAIGICGLVIGGLSPLGNWIILPLEERFPRPDITQPGMRIDGIIILGGFEEGRITVARRSLQLNEASERLTEPVSLARRFPSAKVIFTGGSGVLLGKGEAAAEQVRDFLLDAGIERDRILLEDASRNTRENATLTFELLQPQPGSRWLLVTSAYHMPRSISIFRQAGFQVIAWPVDFRTAGAGDKFRFFDSIDNGLRRLDTAAKEYVGLVVYRMRGWTDALWPGPSPVK